MSKDKNRCVICEKYLEDCLPFHFIDDWMQFTVYVCQDCLDTMLVKRKNFECEEKWDCPICQKNYCCTICGSKDHATPDCPSAMEDGETIEDYMNRLLPSFRKKTIQWFAVTPSGIMPLGEIDVDKTPREDFISFITNRSNISLPFDIKRQSRDIQAKISWLLKRADDKFSIYQDTDSFILPEMSESELVGIIKNLPDHKNLIAITGERGMGKTTSAIKLWETLSKNNENLDVDFTKGLTFIPTIDNKEFGVFPSVYAMPIGIFKRVGVMIETWFVDRKKKTIRAKVYIINNLKNQFQVIKASSISIPFCSDENYKKYRSIVLKELERTKTWYKIKLD